MYFARPPEPNFHPEFGVMCPSSTFRRVVRVALVSITVGATVGAIVVLAVVPHSDLHGERALNIIFADPAAAGSADAAPAAKPSPSPPSPNVVRMTIASRKAQNGPAPTAERAAASEDARITPKKKKKKIAQRRERQRQDDADGRDRGDLAYGRRPDGTRDGGW